MMSTKITRRELLAGAGASAAALLLEATDLQAQQPAAGRPIIFSNTTVVNADAVRNDVALAVVGNTIAAIGPTDQILRTYANADIYDGRGKALFPGLINCHAHLTATLQRGFNEDFGFPNSAKLAVQPGSLLQGEEATLMVVVGALEAIRTGTTTFVENAGGIGRYAGALAKTGLRWVFAESIRDSENVPGPMSPDGLAKSETPRFSPRLRDQGLQQINDVFSAWHGKNQGRIRRPRRASIGHRVRNGGRRVHHAEQQGAHDGRSGGHSRSGRRLAANLGQGGARLGTKVATPAMSTAFVRSFVCSG